MISNNNLSIKIKREARFLLNIESNRIHCEIKLMNDKVKGIMKNNKCASIKL